MSGARWNPWQALRARHHIDLHRHDVARVAGGGFYASDGKLAVIVLDPNLSRVDRRAVLAHELVHDERGGGAQHDGMPDTWRPVVARDELAVDRTVAERLVPRDELIEVLEDLAEVLDGVTAADVAEVFDVPERVAALAVTMLLDDQRGRAA